MGRKSKLKAREQTLPMEVEEVEDGKESKKLRTHLKIEAVKRNPKKVSPIIGYFPTGFNPINNVEDDDQEKNPDPKVRVLKNVDRSNRLQLVVSPNKSPVEFVGTNYSGESATPQMCTYALGVLDKQTGTLKIVQIEANKIFRLEPKVREPLLPRNAASDSLKKETAKEKDNRALVYQTSKAIIKARKLEEALRCQQDPEYQDNLDKKLEEVEINKKAFEVAESTAYNNARNIPPHDMSTDNVAMVYPIHKIIFSGEWDYLYDIVEHLQAGRELEPDSYPTFVRNRVHILDEMKDEDAKSNLAGIFSYITHLIKFKDKIAMDGLSSAKNHKFPSILSQKFTTMFADSGSKKLANDKRDLLISYVLVLTLIADKFESDPSDIAKDLRMSSIDLRRHFMYLGCKLKSENKVHLATLKAPLQFPDITVKRRRRSGNAY